MGRRQNSDAARPGRDSSPGYVLPVVPPVWVRIQYKGQEEAVIRIEADPFEVLSVINTLEDWDDTGAKESAPENDADPSSSDGDSVRAFKGNHTGRGQAKARRTKAERK